MNLNGFYYPIDRGMVVVNSKRIRRSNGYLFSWQRSDELPVAEAAPRIRVELSDVRGFGG